MPPNSQKSEPRKEDIMKRCMTLCSHPGMIALLCVLSIVQGDALWCKYCSERPEGFPSNAESSSRGILFGYCSELGELNKNVAQTRTSVFRQLSNRNVERRLMET